ncbi:MAG: RdgB/HAM1 family non-canonical purine NTP pyrophosphatase [Elusimicrobia bacterium]|nr:RdgB/HAM1 family non-canonical purine NTP pyrophosphatase [Elusimicrobiota bacterium]
MVFRRFRAQYLERSVINTLKEILIGTHNRHKVQEISHLLSDLPVKVRSLNDFPEVMPVVEDGETLEENALKKSVSYAKSTGLLTLADDTGLDVKALRGAPGVFSARYAGEGCSYKDNNRKLLNELKNIANGDRSARFRCVVACHDPAKNESKVVVGFIEGNILKEARGQQGFGYDPLFFVTSCQKTLAEMTLEEKNRISHRALAVLKAKEILKLYA